MEREDKKNQDGLPGGVSGTDRNLLDDHDFADFMMAEFESKALPTDELAAERIWKRMASALKKPVSRPFKLGLAFMLAASVIAVISLPDISRNFGPGVLREKGAPGSLAALEAYTVAADGSLAIADSIYLRPAMVIAFKAKVVATTSPNIVVALAAKIDDGPVQVVTPMQELTSGDETLIEKHNKVYGYQLLDQERHLRFCLFVAQTKKALDEMVARPEESWRAQVQEQCREFRSGKGN